MNRVAQVYETANVVTATRTLTLSRTPDLIRSHGGAELSAGIVIMNAFAQGDKLIARLLRCARAKENHT